MVDIWKKFNSQRIGLQNFNDTLTLNDSTSAQATVLVFPTRSVWLASHFSPAELQDEGISGDDADPDGDGFSNDEEFNFQNNPRSPTSFPKIISDIVATVPARATFGLSGKALRSRSSWRDST